MLVRGRLSAASTQYVDGPKDLLTSWRERRDTVGECLVEERPVVAEANVNLTVRPLAEVEFHVRNCPVRG